MEALGISSMASLFGDVPYSEVNSEVEDPKFDGQISVFNAALALLDNAIADLGAAQSRDLSEDIYFGGDANKWRAAAHTIKARIYTILRDYPAAYAAAQNGIASADGNLQHIPRGDAAVNSGDKNLFYEPIAGSRAGDIGSKGSYLLSMLDAASDVYRGNAKTDEAARLAYFTIDETTASNNMGVANIFEPQNIVTYQENQLILAEAGARTQGFETGLGHLNDYRAFLNDGGGVNDNFQDMPHVYMPYEAADFEAGGIENASGTGAENALLREIIEERYVSGFGTFMPFDDARRLRTTDPNLLVPFPLNTQAVSQYPERFPYSDDELFSNENAPDTDPGIFTKTEINR